MAKYTKAQLQEMAKTVRQGLIDGDPRAKVVVVSCAVSSTLSFERIRANIDRYAAGHFVPGEASDG